MRIRVEVDPTSSRLKRKVEMADVPAKIVRTLWTTRKFSDSMVVCGGRSIPVHRGVLAAASPFFEKAFEGDNFVIPGPLRTYTQHMHTLTFSNNFENDTCAWTPNSVLRNLGDAIWAMQSRLCNLGNAI
eukprot:8690593-Karenia_brevis.AAC.1